MGMGLTCRVCGCAQCCRERTGVCAGVHRQDFPVGICLGGKRVQRRARECLTLGDNAKLLSKIIIVINTLPATGRRSWGPSSFHPCPVWRLFSCVYQPGSLSHPGRWAGTTRSASLWRRNSSGGRPGALGGRPPVQTKRAFNRVLSNTQNE